MNVNANVKYTASDDSQCCHRAELFSAAGLGLVLLCLFTIALPQDIVWGDSPELAAAAWTLGNPHPTGYSLYILLLHGFQWLPLGTVAFRSHLFSAVCMSVACSIWVLVLTRLLAMSNQKSPATLIASLSATLAFALTPTTWSQAIITEVYAFFVLLCAMNVFILIQAWNAPHKYTIPLLMILSLQLLHHRMSIFLVAVSFGLWIYKLYKDRKEINSRWVIQFIIGLSPCLLLLYFPIRASVDPFLNWYNPSEITRFWEYINGTMYQDILRAGLSYWHVLLSPKEIISHLSLVFMAYGWIGFIILFGWWSVIYQHLKIGLLCTTLFMIYLLFVLLYKTGDWQVFLLPLLLIQTIPLAFGLQQLFVWINANSTVYFTRFAYGLCLALMILPLFAPSEPAQLNRAITEPFNKYEFQFRFGLNHDLSAMVYARTVWNVVQPRDSLITGLEDIKADNEFFPLVYQHIVERRGKNSPLIGANFLRYDWYREQINQRYDLNVPMNQDQIYPSREEWLDDIWIQLFEPLLSRGGVVTPSPRLAFDWFHNTNVTESQFTIPNAIVIRSYRLYLPAALTHRFTAKKDANP